MNDVENTTVASTDAQQRAIRDYLDTGLSEPKNIFLWPAEHYVDMETSAYNALYTALVAEVVRRAGKAVLPKLPARDELIRMTRGRVEPIDDFLVHEAAHVFHNHKREFVGLPYSRNKEWLLPIEFAKRETFAYSCEAYSRIAERSQSTKDRLALFDEYAEHPFIIDGLDVDEHVDILREAVAARNGWKRILKRCAATNSRKKLPPFSQRPTVGTNC